MGCDIHLYVEKKQDGQWVSADKWTPNKYAGEEGEPDMSVEYEDYFYNGRNYNLFAILADVRNGRGFAGCKTGAGFNPIAEPRGVPEDACAEYKAVTGRWDGDGHSHSYFTVSELLAYDWTQTAKLQGWVNAENFEQFMRWNKRQGEGPEESCGDVMGRAIQKISNDEMASHIKAVVGDKRGSEFQEAIASLNPNFYTLVKWEMTYAKCCRTFLSETMPKLWKLGKPDDVRIVFFFDN